MSDDVEVKFGADVSDFVPSLNQLRFAIEGLTNPLRAIRSTLGDVGDAFIAAFAVDKIIDFTKAMAAMGLEVQDVGQQLGETVEQVTRFQALAESVGVSGGAATNALERMARGLSMTAQTGSPAQRAMEALGIAYKDAEGNIKPLQDLLPNIAAQFQNMADGPNKTAIAIALFGRAGAEMIPILDKGTVGMQAMADEADRLGVTLGQVAVSGMVAVGNKTNELGEAFAGLKNKTFEAMEPLLLKVLTVVDQLVEAFSQWAFSFETFSSYWGPLETSLKEFAISAGELIGSITELASEIWNLGSSTDDAGKSAVTFKSFMQDLTTQTIMFSAEIRRSAADVQYFIANAGGLIDEAKAIWLAGQGMFDAAGVSWRKGVKEQADAINAYNDKVGEIFGDQVTAEIRNRTVNFLNWENDQIQNFTTMLENMPMVGSKQAPALGDGGAQAQKIADVKLKIKEQEALGEIAIESQKNQSLFALGQENLSKFISQSEVEAGSKLNAEVTYFNAKAAADAKDKAKVLEDLAGRQKAYNDYYLTIAKLHTQFLVEGEKIEAEDTLRLNQQDDKRLEASITSIQNRFKNHQITVEQEAALEIGLTNKILKEEITRLEMLQEGLDAESDAYKKYEAEIEAIQQRITVQTMKSNQQVQDSYTKTADKIASTMTGALTSMLTSTQTWQQQVINILNRLVNVFMTSVVEPMLKQWIAGELAQVAATQTAEVAKVAAKTEGASEANASTVASSIKTIGQDAAKAFSGVYAWASPIMGPFAAIPAAAAFTAVIAMEGLASAAGGMEVNADQLVNVHKDEMILPASLSDGIRAMVSSGGGQTQGGDHYNISISAVDAQGVSRLFSQSGSALVQALARQRRNANPNFNRVYAPS